MNGHIRRPARRLLVVAVALFAAGIVGGALATLVGSTPYRATARIALPASPPRISGVYVVMIHGDAAFTTFATNPVVTEPVAGATNGQITPSQLAHKISVTQTDLANGESVLAVHVVDADASRAADYANATASQLARMIRYYSMSSGANQTSMNAQPIGLALPPSSRYHMHWSRNLNIGGAVGLAIALTLVLGIRRDEAAAEQPTLVA